MVVVGALVTGQLKELTARDYLIPGKIYQIDYKIEKSGLRRLLEQIGIIKPETEYEIAQRVKEEVTKKLSQNVPPGTRVIITGVDVDTKNEIAKVQFTIGSPAISIATILVALGVIAIAIAIISIVFTFLKIWEILPEPAKQALGIGIILLVFGVGAFLIAKGLKMVKETIVKPSLS